MKTELLAALGDDWTICIMVGNGHSQMENDTCLYSFAAFQHLKNIYQ